MISPNNNIELELNCSAKWTNHGKRIDVRGLHRQHYSPQVFDDSIFQMSNTNNVK